MWQPIETAPMDQFLLLCGPSGYTTTPMVVTTGRMCSDYHAGRWIDHANDDLTEWSFGPTHWMPLPDLPGAQPAPSVPDGWKLVPIEPRHETLMDIVGAVAAPLSFREVRTIYDTVLAAPEAKP